MQKGWSIFFGVVLGATFVLWLVAPLAGWWLPQNVASFGGEVDFLFYVILGFTGFFFVLTEALLVWFMYRYAYNPARRAVYVEGNHRLEIAWTIVPALILLFIAFAQVKAWENIKYQSRMPKPDLILQANVRQWEWRFRYPAEIEPYRVTDQDAPETQKEKDARIRGWVGSPQIDDLHVPNDLHVWKGAKVKVFLKTQDVLHSLFLPNLRLKQDALPGKIIPIWFEATASNTRYDDKSGTWQLKEPRWEIACAELCGSGHYRMRGLLFVHESREDYEKWLAQEKKAQRSRTLEEAAIVARK